MKGITGGSLNSEKGESSKLSGLSNKISVGSSIEEIS
jgi:hypothetical protein